MTTSAPSDDPTRRFRSAGQDVVIYPTAKIVAPEVVGIGNAVIIDDFVFITGGQGVVIGDFVHIASFVSCTGGGELRMADFSGLSSGVRIFSGNEDYSGAGMTNPTVPAPYRTPIRSFVRIEAHALIGANAVILPGVTIGTGAIVGANSTVSSDCTPWTVYVGNPARPVKRRPADEILRLERELRARAYTRSGAYIPKAQREPGGGA